MVFIILIDCAFSFFQNYPCRLIPTELECDLPCEESFFDAPHPYQEPTFSPKRSLTVVYAFERFFAHETNTNSLQLQDGRLTALDMFLLIHRE